MLNLKEIKERYNRISLNLPHSISFEYALVCEDVPAMLSLLYDICQVLGVDEGVVDEDELSERIAKLQQCWELATFSAKLWWRDFSRRIMAFEIAELEALDRSRQDEARRDS